ncbi:PLP-dependent cysteine synthase family protein [Ruminococcus albus]|uniref:Cysteine synthase n=1 Tax=Ruminococcus albus (strain ATCC 27210 / DSM 20455 / JCM 14654 / NCDO 2250 / 7) TaxID=697329 RepID=E6UE55_RUMA7|nr:cysteine synthase family protein [Ruminococcus albus]ADU22920.1 Pyridoxal-5'-phosphate-dependent protein beta subunit [Ruminococcus albus 7 = DSM 20455]
MIYENMHDLIGHTPLVRLNNMGVSPDVQIYGKLEMYNPSGSVKDRIGEYMIAAAEKEGRLKPGSTIIEATAGNTGLGIAFAALGKGYRVIFTVPTKFSAEKQALMRALGAEVINTPRAEGMLGAVRKAEELKAQIPDSISLEQFKNPNNPLAHYENTGREIWEDIGGKVTHFVAGAGSGGTYTGIARYLKEHDPNIVGVLADPEGSTIGGGEHFDYNIEGIGNDFIPETMDIGLVDEVIKVNDDDAFRTVGQLARNEGIIAGSSSGAAAAAALKLAKRIEKGVIVAVLPDRGDRYFSTGLFG